MSDKHWYELAAEALWSLLRLPTRVPLIGQISTTEAADAIRTALAGYTVIRTDTLREIRDVLTTACVSRRANGNTQEENSNGHLFCSICQFETPISRAWKWRDAQHKPDCPLSSTKDCEVS